MPALSADKKTDFSDLITGQKPDAFLKNRYHQKTKGTLLTGPGINRRFMSITPDLRVSDFFFLNTQSTVKNRKNYRSDTSLQVDHRAMFMVPVWSPFSHQGGYPASLPLPLGGW